MYKYISYEMRMLRSVLTSNMVIFGSSGIRQAIWTCCVWLFASRIHLYMIQLLERLLGFFFPDNDDDDDDRFNLICIEDAFVCLLGQSGG